MRFNAFCNLNLIRLIDSVERNQGIERVLDIGAGVGHLSRYLSYNYRLQVLAESIECKNRPNTMFVSM